MRGRGEKKEAAVKLIGAPVATLSSPWKREFALSRGRRWEKKRIHKLQGPLGKGIVPEEREEGGGSSRCSSAREEPRSICPSFFRVNPAGRGKAPNKGEAGLL